MKKFSFKSPSSQLLSTEKRTMRAEMLRVLPEELLARVRGGIEECCHTQFCCCGNGCVIVAASA